MSTIRSNKKKVSFLEVGESRKTNLKRSNLKRGSILKSRPKMIEEEKVIEPIENKTEKVKIEIKKEEPVDIKSKTSLKNLPTDEYFKLTVQDVLQQGLLNIAMVHPTDPIRFLGNFLIEKSKRASIM
jgi:hypothetical protein